MPVEYSVGWPVDKHTGRAIALLPPEAWTPMLAVDGLPGVPAILDAQSTPDTVGEVAEITHPLPNLRHWPQDLQVFARRVKPLRDTTPTPLPGTGQLELDLQLQAAGWRYEAFATNSPPTQTDENPDEVAAWLDGRHRVHARVEDHFRVGNTTGADRLPSQHFTTNTAWYRTHAIACDLIAWLRLLACHDTMTRAEPATLQHRIFHTPATPHPRRPATPAQLPTPLALDPPHPGHLRPPAHTARPNLTTHTTAPTTTHHRLENGAHRGDTRHHHLPTRQNPHPTTTRNPHTSTPSRS